MNLFIQINILKNEGSLEIGGQIKSSNKESTIK